VTIAKSVSVIILLDIQLKYLSANLEKKFRDINIFEFYKIKSK
jgi:hypothetical protein